jgi:hypothetical protein
MQKVPAVTALLLAPEPCACHIRGTHATQRRPAGMMATCRKPSDTGGPCCGKANILVGNAAVLVADTSSCDLLFLSSKPGKREEVSPDDS